MRFDLVDRVIERDANRIVTIKQVSLAEEYLQDHFPGYPVLPGVLMIEAMVQSARVLLADRVGASDPRRFALGHVRAMKYGSFVRPGEALEVEVRIDKELEDGSVSFRGTSRVRRTSDATDVTTDDETAASGRFTMRRVTPSRKEMTDVDQP